ncbi:hypothetical protein [Brucella intermedia]|uniref:hypothetical protein n=1 Tax=Brucella intermedia TaxID=94625 RepID=UPI00046A3A73|nr:hypothetical protein [Brucella intermedia]
MKYLLIYVLCGLGSGLWATERFPEQKGIGVFVGLSWPVWMAYGAMKAIDSQLKLEAGRAALRERE